MKPLTQKTVWLAGVLALLPIIGFIIMQVIMITNTSGIAGDVREIHADVAAIRDHDGFAETNRALAQLIEQSRVTERLLDRAITKKGRL